MVQFAATLARGEIRRFQPIVPPGGHIRIAQEHHRRCRAQAYSLTFHGPLVLIEKYAGKTAYEQGQERHPAETIPRGAEVNAALVLRDWCDRGLRGKPPTAGLHQLQPQVRQHKIDCCCHWRSRQAQKFIGRTVTRGTVSAHAEAGWQWLKYFRFFMDAGAAAPPHTLVHEGTMGWVHQTNDAIIDAAGQDSGDVE
jgi:hypothetical protein